MARVVPHVDKDGTTGILFRDSLPVGIHPGIQGDARFTIIDAFTFWTLLTLDLVDPW